MRTIADIDVLGDEALQRGIARLSLALLVVTALLAALLALALGGERLDVWWWVTLALGSLVALPVHELVHAAAFKLLCPGCRVSFGFKEAFLYTKTDGALLRRGCMVAVLLAPSVLVTAALVALVLGAGLPVLAVLLAGAHLSGCAGDILMASATLREGTCTHARDTETGITLLCDREEDA
ncbi:MAG: DUF3267 domain-containing protein [Atopobiaceae bacterium]|nr:DUF3267 domain-containing protein [Atopobiaceae bacterium]